jgi:isoleucyl-tRNA synthetase
MRWFLMASPVLRGGNLVVTEKGIRDGVRQVLIPLWNTWYFFSLYANAANGGEGLEARWRTDFTHVLDRYLLATTRRLVLDVTEQLVTQFADGLRAELQDQEAGRPQDARQAKPVSGLRLVLHALWGSITRPFRRG